MDTFARPPFQVIRTHLQISADSVAMHEASASKDDLIDPLLRWHLCEGGWDVLQVAIV